MIESVFVAWILQTYLRLKEYQFPCFLVNTMPEEGIVIAYRYSLPYEEKPKPNVLWVCTKGDRNPHPYAQLHVVQNRREQEAPPMEIQCINEDRYLLPGKRYYLPHWPQPGIIPRDPARLDRFENVAYFGISYNLAPELRQESWQRKIEELGLRWCPEKREARWSDYSQVDVIIAVRSFDEKDSYPWKPASKLYNAWNAGVPAILGPESAFQAERKSELDYIEVKNYEEAIAALQRLRDNPDLRRAMMENAKVRAEEIKPEYFCQLWCNFLLDICVPAYEKWRSTSSWDRQQFFLRRYLAVKLNALQRRIAKLIVDS